MQAKTSYTNSILSNSLKEEKKKGNIPQKQELTKQAILGLALWHKNYWTLPQNVNSGNMYQCIDLCVWQCASERILCWELKYSLSSSLQTLKIKKMNKLGQLHKKMAKYVRFIQSQFLTT